jgi:hypothetical protein
MFLLYPVHHLPQFPDNTLGGWDSALLSKSFEPTPLHIPVKLAELNEPRTKMQVNYVCITPLWLAAHICLTVEECKELLYNPAYGHNSDFCVICRIAQKLILLFFIAVEQP